MVSTIVTAFEGMVESLASVANAAIPVGTAALLVWVGFRLAAKLTNRGVGK